MVEAHLYFVFHAPLLGLDGISVAVHRNMEVELYSVDLPVALEEHLGFGDWGGLGS